MDKVLVGMSGGVDSAVTALLLKEQGMEVTGINLDLQPREDDGERKRLNVISRQLDIPIIRINGRDAFREHVIQPFLSDYGCCRTPNPCVLCNERVKLKLLFQCADRMGVQYVSTGHYARLINEGDEWYIARGGARSKDQSYMLYRLRREWLPRLIFPLGDDEKVSVRARGEAFFSETVDFGGESQDICFVPSGSLPEFLKKHLRPQNFTPGPIYSVEGEYLGKHRGLCLYTVGQRKGLALGGGPWYVVALNGEENSVIVGRRKHLNVVRVECHMLAWQHRVYAGGKYLAQHRYRCAPVNVRVVSITDSCLEVETEKSLQGVAPGQSLVLYSGERVMGGGIIHKAKGDLGCR